MGEALEYAVHKTRVAEVSVAGADAAGRGPIVLDILRAGELRERPHHAGSTAGTLRAGARAGRRRGQLGMIGGDFVINFFLGVQA